MLGMLFEETQVKFYVNDFSLRLNILLANKITCNTTSIGAFNICIFSFKKLCLFCKTSELEMKNDHLI